jgi:hypothetical protein
MVVVVILATLSTLSNPFIAQYKLSLRSMNSFKYRYNKAIDHEDYSNVIIIFMADYHRIIICHEDFSTNLKIIYDFIIYLC